MPNNTNDQISFSEKLLELKGLFIFVLCAAAASVIIMNLLILPISVFAVTHKYAFTLSVKIFFLIFSLAFITFKIRRLIINSRKKNVSALQSVSSAAGRRIRKIGYFITSAVLIFAVVFLMYFILTSNSQLIYEMMK
jgi:hypothetical protein